MPLILVPTPIDDQSPLEPVAQKLLLENINTDAVFLVEELKEGRRRWLRFGLPRESIEHFIAFNEQTQSELLPQILKYLKDNKNVFLMSDCGLPAFCDPGQVLVDQCHRQKIAVTATPFANSIALAVALSGFVMEKFFFAGFVPREQIQREKEMINLWNQPHPVILMDTPYRLKSTVQELIKISNGRPKREVFVGLDLNGSKEQLFRGDLVKFEQEMTDWKREFIIIIG